MHALEAGDPFLRAMYLRKEANQEPMTKERFIGTAKEVGKGMLAFGAGLAAGAATAHAANYMHGKIQGHEIPIKTLKTVLPLVSGAATLAYQQYKAREQDVLLNGPRKKTAAIKAKVRNALR